MFCYGITAFLFFRNEDHVFLSVFSDYPNYLDRMCLPNTVLTATVLTSGVSARYEHVKTVTKFSELGQLWMHVIRTEAVALSPRIAT